MTVGADLPLGKQTGEPAPVMPQAAPAYAETSPPLPLEYEETLSGTAAEFCSWSTCEIETLLLLLIFTLGGTLLLALGVLTFKFLEALRAAFWGEAGLPPDRGRR